MTTAIEALIEHIQHTHYQDLPEETVVAAKTFIFDSIGVGICGSRVGRVDQVKAGFSQAGTAKQAQIWATGEWLPAEHAAAINAYQIHNQEWDCVHEQAVVHPMATIFSALTAFAQREQLSGEQLLLGTVIAVDVATLIGQSVTSGLKFFRPSVCGSLGATAGLCAMVNANKATIENALGIAYSKLSGTMQAHVEGSPMLAMQIGFNAQSAIQAFDFAHAGFEGPKDILEGPFGYFKLFEDDYNLSLFWEKLGNKFQIEEVSHKPFPTGRAGHGTIDGLQCLQRNHGFGAKDVASVDVTAPPLIHRLVGRPAKQDMDANYAKLCHGYLAATALLTGSVSVEDFSTKLLNCKERLSLANKVSLSISDETNPNALSPIVVKVTLNDGQTFQMDLQHILGHPLRPMSKPAQVKKFVLACKSAKVAFSSAQIDKLINRIDALEQIPNINDLVNLMIHE